MRVTLIQHNAEWRMKGVKAKARKIFAEPAKTRFVAHGRIWIRRRRGRFGRILAAPAVNVVKHLGLRVVRFQIFVGKRPRRRDSTVMRDFAEVLLAKPKQGGAKEFSIAAHVIVGMRFKLFPSDVAPDLFCPVLSLNVNRTRLPVVLLAPHITAALQNENALAGRSEAVRKSRTARARADNHDVVMIHR